MTYDTDEFAKDAFFICLIFLPYIFLLKSPKWKYILYIIFAAIAFISTKRTILIATILSGVLFFLKTKRGKESLALVILFVIIFSFSPLSKDIIANTSDRFLSIGEDGGSGRNTLYFQIWTDISSNYSTQDILVGKGFGLAFSWNGCAYGHIADSTFIRFYRIDYLSNYIYHNTI